MITEARLLLYERVRDRSPSGWSKKAGAFNSNYLIGAPV
jgi:hypothetical protein